MKSLEQIQQEIDALSKRGARCPDNKKEQSSIQGQIDVLMWVSDYKCEVKAPKYA